MKSWVKFVNSKGCSLTLPGSYDNIEKRYLHDSRWWLRSCPNVHGFSCEDCWMLEGLKSVVVASLMVFGSTMSGGEQGISGLPKFCWACWL